MAENAAVARPYAQAVFELANAAGQLAQWSDALHAAGAGRTPGGECQGGAGWQRDPPGSMMA